MPSSAQDLPLGHSTGSETPIRSSVELGAVIRDQRKRLALKQLDLAGLGNTGNRFIVDLENGKPTVRLDKLLMDRGLAETRSKALALVMSGSVSVDGRVVTKAGYDVKANKKL